MALFCSSCKPPILFPKFPINHAIQRPLKSKTSIPGTPYFEISKISISAPTKILNNKAKYCSNLTSPVELLEEPPSSVVIFVKGLAQSTGEGGLKAAFSRFGEISRGATQSGPFFNSVKVVLDKKTKQSLGFAYVWFVREEHARTAIEEMNGQFLEGRFIHVVLAKPGSCKARPKPSAYKF